MPSLIEYVFFALFTLIIMFSLYKFRKNNLVVSRIISSFFFVFTMRVFFYGGQAPPIYVTIFLFIFGYFLIFLIQKFFNIKY